MKPFSFLPLALAFGLTACGGGSVSSSAHLHGPKPPPMRFAKFEPNAPYGSANATWAPPVFNRGGTIVKPTDPRNDTGRPDYEHAPWATGAAGSDQYAPAGTW